jgi:hypothetical protein
MANIAYFADLGDGTTLEFKEGRQPTGGRDRYGNAQYRFVPAKVNYLRMPGDDRDRLYGFDPERGAVRITRQVVMKSNPSRHECDARCMNANGRTMNCECSCGGANHGKGRFMCEAA